MTTNIALYTLLKYVNDSDLDSDSDSNNSETLMGGLGLGLGLRWGGLGLGFGLGWVDSTTTRLKVSTFTGFVRFCKSSTNTFITGNGEVIE